jgi:1-acyl-sn-glycerol-3-phosphate acyltransferase
MVKAPALFRNPRPGLAYWLISYLVVYPVFRLLLRGRTIGSTLLIDRPMVVVANHGSHLDPPLICHALGRPVAFMAKQELFRVPLLGQLIRALGAFPVDRGGGDRQAIRLATDRLRQGWHAGVFLDGTRQLDGRVNDPLPGAALLAARAGVPLLPVAIVNSHLALGAGQRTPRLVRVHIRVGTPIPAPASRRRPDLEAATRACQESINRMLEEGLISAGRFAPAREKAALPPSPSDRGR